MSWRTEAIQDPRADNLIDPEDVADGAIAVTPGSGQLIRREGYVTDEEAGEGGRFEGMGGLPAFRRLATEERCYMIPGNPVIVIGAEEARELNVQTGHGSIG